MADGNLTEEQIKHGNKGKIFGLTAPVSLLMVVDLAMFLAGSKTDVAWVVSWQGYRLFAPLPPEACLNSKVGVTFLLNADIAYFH